MPATPSTRSRRSTACCISCSVTCWPPTLARVELPIPKPMLPDPKLRRSLTATPARIAIRIAAMIHVPILDLETRRKKESMTIRLSKGAEPL